MIGSNDALQLLQQENAKLRLQLDEVMTSSHDSVAQHQADLDDMQHRLDDAQTRVLARQRADQQRIDELTEENERLSEQLLTVSCSANITY